MGKRKRRDKYNECPGYGYMPGYMPDWGFDFDQPMPYPGGTFGPAGGPIAPGFGMPGYGMPEMPGYDMGDYCPGMPEYPMEGETEQLIKEIYDMTSDIKNLCNDMYCTITSMHKKMMEMHKKMEDMEMGMGMGKPKG